MMLILSLIILTGISLLCQAFLLSRFYNSLNVFFLSINLKKNDRVFLPIISLILNNAWVIFILSDCTENWISNMWVSYIVPKIIFQVAISIVQVSEIFSLIFTQNTPQKFFCLL